MKLFWNYIYALFAIALITTWTFLCSLLAFLVSFTTNKKWHNCIIAMWSAVVLKILVAHIQVENKERLQDQGCLLLFNHLSLMDIPLVYRALGSDFRFGAKIELFKIPVFGHAIKRYGFLPIERGNRSKTMKTYDKAKVRSQNGERFILAPEGTRQSCLKLGAFKSGPFILAIQAGIPIVPVVLSGTEKVWPKHRLLPSLSHKVVLQVHVLEPISTIGYTIEQRGELKDLVWQRMNLVLEKLKTAKPDAANT